MQSQLPVLKTVWFVLFAGGLLSFAQGADRPATPEIPRLKQIVETLTRPEWQGRGLLTHRREVAAYLVKSYQELNLTPLFPNGTYIQEIPGLADTGEGSKPPQKNLLGLNVGAAILGGDPQLKDEWIIVSSHFDHLAPRGERIYPGADDNAAAVAMGVEIARTLKQLPLPLKRSVAFVNFDLEEHLLWGSRWFVDHSPMPHEKIALMLTADLIGRTLGDLPLPMLFVLGGEHGQGIANRLTSPAEEGSLQVGPLGVDIVGTRSDYGPFRDRQIPFLFFSSGQHPDYHSPRDRPEKIQYDRLQQISCYVLGCVREAANADQRATWIAQPKPELQEVRTLQTVTALLLSPGQEQKLKPRDRVFVSQFDALLRRILKQGTYTQDDRARVVRSAQWMLLTLF